MRAGIETVDPDIARARDFLAALARRVLQDADGAALHPESAVVLYWQACISDGCGRRRGYAN
jgi:hypothetical protein